MFTVDFIEKTKIKKRNQDWPIFKKNKIILNFIFQIAEQHRQIAEEHRQIAERMAQTEQLTIN